MTQHLSNLARRAATGLKHQVAQRAARLADVPHELKHQIAHQFRHHLPQHMLTLIALIALVFSMGGTWTLASSANAAPSRTPVVATTAAGNASTSASASTNANATRASSPASDPRGTNADDTVAPRPAKKEVTGKLNLNTATEAQLMLLPTIGPSKAERVVTWRKKNGGFKRTADIRRVKGFGYKTFKRLEPFLDIKGDTTLATKH